MFYLRKIGFFFAITVFAAQLPALADPAVYVKDYFMVSGKPADIAVLTGSDFRALVLVYNDWKKHSRSHISDYTITFARKPASQLDYITLLPRRDAGLTLGCATRFGTGARYIVDAHAGKILHRGIC